jgi:hypothetical protein
MNKYRKKPVVIEALTFDEFIGYGLEVSDSIVDGVPWAFEINGFPITHENDDFYWITTLEGTMGMTKDDMLIIGVDGEVYPCKKSIFEKTYERVTE